MQKPKTLKERLAAKGKAAKLKARETAAEKPRAKPKKRPGPPAGSGWNRALEDRIVELLEHGCFLETAAAGAGVDVETVRRWLKHGARELARRERGETPDETLDHLVAFRERISAALVSAENEAARRVTQAGAHDWRASAFYLERRAPQRWGLRIGQLVSEELEAFLDALEERLPPDVFVQVLRAASDATRSGKAPPARRGEPA